MQNVYEELGETSRRLILGELRSGAKNVSDIVSATGLKQPNVSNHLSRMRARNIVRASKLGRQVYYSLGSPEVEAIVQAAFSHESPELGTLDIDDLARRYAKAAIMGDEQACSDALDVAFRQRMPMIDIYQEILTPAMMLVGNWYKAEAIDEAQEHMASAITERMMARTVQVTGPARRHGKTALLGCAPNAWHVIGLRMIGDYLRFCGWRTLFLGANVPLRSYLSAVSIHRPDLVLLSCGANEAMDSTAALVEALSELRGKGKHRFTIGVGGVCAGLHPTRFTAAGADFTANDLRHFANDLLPTLERSGS